MYDAVILGGGPAGATAARLLALWGRSVLLLDSPPAERTRLAECLPPSTLKLFRFLGIHDAIEQAGFFRTAGNTVWWGKTGRRVEPYPQGLGYQVPRADFDRLLMDLARAAGACIQSGKAFHVTAPAGPRIEVQSGAKRTAIEAKFILDCSGRAGVIGRGMRLKEKNSRTVALCGVWRNERGWKLPDASHTLVEAYADGWAWSIPASPHLRYVAFMVDPGASGMLRGKGLAAAYHAELAKTRAFRKIFSHGTLAGAPWGRDASLYSSRRFAGPGFLVAGDAGAFIDPLSSFGVKKAMVSAWVGAVAANTWLAKPAMQEVALQFFDDRERRVYADHLQRASVLFRQGAGSRAHPFWANRSEIDETAPLADQAAARAALASLKRKPSIRLRRAENLRFEPRPGIEDREIVLRDAVLVPGIPEALDYLESVHLARLVQLAEQYRQVPDLYEAYNRTGPPVPLPNFLAALSSLLARGILRDRAGRPESEPSL